MAVLYYNEGWTLDEAKFHLRQVEGDITQLTPHAAKLRELVSKKEKDRDDAINNTNRR